MPKYGLVRTVDLGLFRNFRSHLVLLGEAQAEAPKVPVHCLPSCHMQTSTTHNQCLALPCHITLAMRAKGHEMPLETKRPRSNAQTLRWYGMAIMAIMAQRFLFSASWPGSALPLSQQLLQLQLLPSGQHWPPAGLLTQHQGAARISKAEISEITATPRGLPCAVAQRPPRPIPACCSLCKCFSRCPQGFACTEICNASISAYKHSLLLPALPEGYKRPGLPPRK